MDGTNLTILVALAAGVISFLSPCVLPLVPAYLGQLTAIAVAGSAPGATPSRWLAVRHALAYVAGFGAVFTVLGITATFAAGPLVDYLPALRTIGGIVLIILGLDLAGLLQHPRPEPHMATARRRRIELAGDRDRDDVIRLGHARRRPSVTGSAATSSARAAAGSRRSGSARSSPSAGARASASSSAAS